MKRIEPSWIHLCGRFLLKDAGTPTTYRNYSDIFGLLYINGHNCKRTLVPDWGSWAIGWPNQRTRLEFHTPITRGFSQFIRTLQP